MGTSYENCFTLRKYVGTAWQKLVKKHQKHLKTRAVGTHASKDAAAGAILSGAGHAASLFDDIPVDANGDPAVMAIVGLSAMTIKLFAEGSGAKHQQAVHDQASTRETATTLSRIGNAVGLCGSIVAALFDPTGLSIVSLCSSIASTGADEARIAAERKNWKEHYCPALDDAMVEAREKLSRERVHYGPVANNADCLERPDEESCTRQKVMKKSKASGKLEEKVVETRCVWDGEGRVCTPCPRTTSKRCAHHKAPNGKMCAFEAGGLFSANKCCALYAGGGKSQQGAVLLVLC